MYSFNFCLGKCVWGEKIALFCPIWNRNDSTVYSWMVSLPILAFCCWHFGSGRKNLACFVFWHFGMLMGNNAAASQHSVFSTKVGKDIISSGQQFSQFHFVHLLLNKFSSLTLKQYQWWETSETSICWWETMPPLASTVCLAQKCVMIISRLTDNFIIKKKFLKWCFR